jgi:hypothetical protein
MAAALVHSVFSESSCHKYAANSVDGRTVCVCVYAMFSPITSGLSQVNPNFMVHKHLLLVVNGVSFGITAP